MRKLSEQELDVISAYASANGRTWKSKLHDAWMDGDYGCCDDAGTLQSIRNTFGPTWLVRFSLKKSKGVL